MQILQPVKDQNSQDNYKKASSDEQNKETGVQVQLGIQPPYKWPVLISSSLLIAATIIVNYVVGASTGRNAEVSGIYQLWVTPPGYFFTIWIVIFIGLAIFGIYNLVKNFWTPKAHIFFAISNVLNILWICIFNIGNDPAVYVCFFILLAIGPFLFLTWRQLAEIPQESFNIGVYISRNIIAFYLGWIIAATNLNFGILLTYWWGASKQAQMIVFWIMAPLCALGVTILNSSVYKLRGFLSCFCLWFSVGWAFAGAAITSNGCLNATITQC